MYVWSSLFLTFKNFCSALRCVKREQRQPCFWDGLENFYYI